MMVTAVSRALVRATCDVTLADALALGGDGRIAIDAATGRNGYGCAVTAGAGLVRFGSSTASTIGAAGWDAAGRLFDRLALGAAGDFRADVATAAAKRIRREIAALAGVAPTLGAEVVLAASGTDAHLIFAQLTLGRAGPAWIVIMPDPAESGSGVPAALAGAHFASETALGAATTKGAAISDRLPWGIVRYAVRNPDGSARSLAAIDAAIGHAISEAITAGRRVLLVAVDVSKTGLVAPSPGSVLGWKRAYGDAVEILVDACQFRLSTDRIACYLTGGCAVAVTGSKFMGGPIFSGALLLPAAMANRLRQVALPPALAAYCARHDWPGDWRAADALARPANVGLLLRWEAALAEMRRFRAVPDGAVRAITEDFGDTGLGALRRIPMLDPVVDMVDSAALGDGIGGDVATIFSFHLLRDAGAAQRRATVAEARHVYQQMPVAESATPGFSARFELGQPVAMPDGTGALRLSLSAPLIVEAYRRGPGYLGALAEEALVKAARLARAIGAERP